MAARCVNRWRGPAPSSVVRLVAGLLLTLSVLASGVPARAAPDAGGSDGAVLPERFFGAVQSIYNPDRAAQAGVQWQRLIFPWSLIQKDGPQSWGPGYFTDEQVAREVARGIQVVGIALYTPQWASSTPKDLRPTNVPANLYLPFDDPRNYWGQFMYRLAQRYRGQIDTWVVWNEPDMYSDTIRYTWDGGVEDLYQLVKVASQAVKKANPNAKIALPGMTYWWDKEGGRPLYLARFLEVAAHDPTARANGFYFDIVTLHQYGNPLNVYAAARVFRDALAIYGLDRPIWVGEANAVPYDDPKHPIDRAFHATMDEQASYVIQAFALGRAAGVERMSIYKLVDEAPEGPGELYGLVRNDGSTRPSFDAYRTATRYLSAPTSAVYTWDGAADPPTAEQVTRLLQSNAQRSQWVWPAAVNRVTLERGEERVTVVWNGSPRPATARIPAAAKSAAVVNKFGRITGEVVARDGEYRLELPPSTNNTDPRDGSLYLVGSDPQIVVERVAPLPRTVETPIQVVWPRGDGSGLANVSALLLQPDSHEPVPCRWTPTVRLWAAAAGQPSRTIGLGARRLVTEAGVTYPVWDFNNVDLSATQTGQPLDLWVEVDGVVTRASRWIHAAEGDPPAFWQQRPTTSCG